MRCRGISRHSSHHISLSANLTNPSQCSHQCRALRWKWQCRDQRDFLLLFWETNGILMHFISLFWNKVKKSWKCEAALLILVLFSFTIITKMHQRLDIKRGILRKQKTHFNCRAQVQVQVQVRSRSVPGQEGQKLTWALPYFWFPPTTHHHTNFFLGF